MVGQENLIKTLKQSSARNILLVGEKTSGKKTLAKELFNAYEIDKAVSSVRGLVDNGATYLLADIDTWSTQSINALLLFLENNRSSKVILSTSKIDNIPTTIISRCQTFHMEKYENLKPYCNTYWQSENTSDDMIALVEKLVRYYNKASIANMLKLEKEILTYDLDLFFTLVMNCSIKERNVRLVNITAQSMQDLEVKSLNKSLFVRNWLLKVRVGGNG